MSRSTCHTHTLHTTHLMLQKHFKTTLRNVAQHLSHTHTHIAYNSFDVTKALQDHAVQCRAAPVTHTHTHIAYNSSDVTKALQDHAAQCRAAPVTHKHTHCIQLIWCYKSTSRPRCAMSRSICHTHTHTHCIQLIWCYKSTSRPRCAMSHNTCHTQTHTLHTTHLMLQKHFRSKLRNVAQHLSVTYTHCIQLIDVNSSSEQSCAMSRSTCHTQTHTHTLHTSHLMLQKHFKTCLLYTSPSPRD